MRCILSKSDANSRSNILSKRLAAGGEIYLIKLKLKCPKVTEVGHRRLSI